MIGSADDWLLVSIVGGSFVAGCIITWLLNDRTTKPASPKTTAEDETNEAFHQDFT